MDPVSAVATVTALVGTCASVAKALNDIRSRYNRAALTITALSSEVTIMSTTLSQLAQLIDRNPQKFISKISSSVSTGAVPLDLALQSAIESSKQTMALLDDTIKKCDSKTRKAKAKFLWSEGDMKDTLEMVRRLQQAIATLLTVIQTESISDVKDILNENSVMLQTVVQRTKTFKFDHEVINSAAYRKVFQSPSKTDESVARDSTSETLVPGSGTASKSMLNLPSSNATRAASDYEVPITPEVDIPVRTPRPRDPELDKLLRVAVESCNMALVETLLNQGVDVEAKGEPNDFRPIHIAVSGKHTQLLKLLLQRGASTRATSNTGYTALHIAAFTGHHESVAALLDFGADVNSDSSVDFTALQYAVKMGHVSVIRQLIDGKADVEATANVANRYRALHVAVEFRQVKAAKMLIEEGKADLEAQLQDENRPLNMAAAYGDIEMGRTLVQAGANVDGDGHAGYSPVHHAAAGGYRPIISYLLEEGAHVSSRARNGETALHCAAKFGHTHLIEYLISAGIDAEVADNESNRPLHLASVKGWQSTVIVLVQQGALADSVGENEETPLLAAVKAGQRRVVEALLNYKVNIEATDKDQNRPLNLAAMWGHPEIAKLLLDSGADIDGHGSSSWRPIHHAAANGHGKVLQLLITRGADIHSHADHDTQPIHAAAEYGQAKIIEELLKVGASAEEVGPKGQRPIHLAAVHKDPAALAVLLRQGVMLDPTSSAADFGYQPIHKAAESGSAKSIELLLKAGVDMQARNSSGNFPINLAARNGNLETSKFLIQSGANLHAQGVLAWTPLHHAAANGRGFVVDFLLAEGAAPEAKAENGMTPLHVAVHFQFEGLADTRVDSARRLLDAGADIEAVTDDLCRPLHYAAKNGDAKSIRLLTSRGASKTAENVEGNTPAELAAECGNANIVELLL